ncbi:cyclic nucleotide-gated ion channel 1-like [Rosa rugosa]|uniref:cyclic nucleotide-gated ion channel 1-like n=1 Tax=Rosa rugosa TaxID=74645 RepID=UPI002B40E1E8|nr:cyclic nucleotide-gated ion channel 1-like [Rosa rugosa]
MINQEKEEHQVEISSTIPFEVQLSSERSSGAITFMEVWNMITKTFMELWDMITKTSMEVWNMKFVISYVIGLIIDPLFLYIPSIDYDDMCIRFDEDMGFGITILRSLIDLTFIVYQVWRSWKKNPLKSHLIINILAVLPIPQVLLALHFRMGRGGELNDIYVANFFLAAQYVPRVYRLVLLFKPYRETVMYGGFLSVFILYFLAGHVLGAFWYFFSIQRIRSCWFKSCMGCLITDYCALIPESNVTMFNDTCSRNASTFNFGIFLEAVPSGDKKSTTLEKLYFSFWWGLRNLSNFGTNLQTSSNLWEIYFVVVISVGGLFLLTIVIGKMQMILQYDEERRRTLRRSKQKLEVWMDRNGVPENLREEMRSMVQKVEGKDCNTEDLTDLGNLFSILPSKTQKTLKRDLCMSTLTKVPRLKDMDVKVLEMMCDYLKPVVFTENSWVVKIDEQLDRMILITEGTMLIYPPNTSTDATLRAAGGADTGSSSMIRKPSLKKGDIYGDELLIIWASSPDMHVTFANLPISKENVKCHSKVEGFALTANDLKKVISKLHWNPFSSDAGEMVPQLGTVGGDYEESDQDKEQSDG